MIPVIPLLLSVLFHAVILLYVPSGQEKKQEQQKIQDRPPVTISATIKPPTPEPAKAVGKGRQATESDCPSKKYYTGIGVLSRFGIIFDVAVGGPADKAGVLVGDAIYRPVRIGPDIYKEGEKIILEVERLDNFITLPVTIGKICYQEPKE